MAKDATPKLDMLRAQREAAASAAEQEAKAAKPSARATKMGLKFGAKTPLAGSTKKV